MCLPALKDEQSLYSKDTRTHLMKQTKPNRPQRYKTPPRLYRKFSFLLSSYWIKQKSLSRHKCFETASQANPVNVACCCVSTITLKTSAGMYKWFSSFFFYGCGDTGSGINGLTTLKTFQRMPSFNYLSCSLTPSSVIS